VSAKSDKVIDADSVFVTLKFSDGSNGSIAYLAEGDKALAKERIEIFGSGSSFVLDDFKRATSYKNGKENQINLKAQDKGQADQIQALCASLLTGGPVPISFEELVLTTRTTFRILDSLREKLPMAVVL